MPVSHPIRLALFTLSLVAASCAPATATPPPAPYDGPTAEAILAGGCFWCVESAFDELPGVIQALSGYDGGAVRNPTYKAVSAGSTGHAEVVKVVYDPTRVTYERLLDVFWHNIDPTQGDGQFCDLGTQYRSAIFVTSDEQRRLAEASRDALVRSGVLKAPVVTEITSSTGFWPAEAYHQDFWRKNPTHYRSYRLGCGRDRRLRALWGDQAGHGG